MHRGRRGSSCGCGSEGESGSAWHQPPIATGAAPLSTCRHSNCSSIAVQAVRCVLGQVMHEPRLQPECAARVSGDYSLTWACLSLYLSLSRLLPLSNSLLLSLEIRLQLFPSLFLAQELPLFRQHLP